MQFFCECHMTARRRDKPLPGFPVEERFTTIESVREYLNHNYETITCLQCGRKLKGLAYHVWKMHGMTVDEYRDMYGIPWTYGLNSPEVSERQSEHSKKLVRDGKITGNPDMESVRQGKEHERPRPEVRKQINAENLAEVNRDCDGEYTRKKALAPKRGSEEHKAACRARVTEMQKEILRKVWVGKKRHGERGKMVRDDE